MKLPTIAAGAIMLLAVTPAPAQKEPEKIRLNPQSKDGALLIRVPIQAFDYTLMFSKDGNSGFLSRVYMMKIGWGTRPGYRYIARTLPPGRYRLDSIIQQGSWIACLEKSTFEVTIAAGRIAYLGTLRTEPVLSSIQQEAISNGQTTMRGTGYALSHDITEKPALDGREESDIATAREFAETTMNKSGQLIDLASVTETGFTTSDTGKAIKVCG